MIIIFLNPRRRRRDDNRSSLFRSHCVAKYFLKCVIVKVIDTQNKISCNESLSFQSFLELAVVSYFTEKRNESFHLPLSVT